MEAIHLHFIDFHVEFSRTCQFDSVDVYEAETPDPAKRLGETMCGYHSEAKTVTSSSPVVLLEFRSDYMFERKGFNITYEIVEKSNLIEATKYLAMTTESKSTPDELETSTVEVLETRRILTDVVLPNTMASDDGDTTTFSKYLLLLTYTEYHLSFNHMVTTLYAQQRNSYRGFS